MPLLLDPQTPPEVQSELGELGALLDKEIPPKILDRNLLIATWNLRTFGDLTDKWQSAPGDSPARDWESLCIIGEILSRFDVIAVQEVRGNIKCLRHALKLLGPHWGFTLTDVCKGKDGNGERLAFLFDTRRVQLSGLACELVIADEELQRPAADAMKEQFARSPYAVSFKPAGKTFILVTLHIKYGANSKERAPELKAIAQWLAGWGDEISNWDHNLITLGDFNVDRRDDPLYQALTSTGLCVPDDLQKVPRTIFADPAKPDLDHFYDQIAWFAGANNGSLPSLQYTHGGNFDFTRVALKSRNLTRQGLSWHISDHFPLWAEFLMENS